jgi:hypothetical protein
MGMQHRTGAAQPGDRQVEARLRGGPARSCYDRAVLVDLHDLTGRERAFVHAAAGDGEAQGILVHYGAEVPAGAEGPPPSVELAPDLGQLGCHGGRAHVQKYSGL